MSCFYFELNTTFTCYAEVKTLYCQKCLMHPVIAKNLTRKKNLFFRQQYTTGHGSDILTPSVQAQQQPQETSWHPVVVRLFVYTCCVFNHG